MYLNENSNKKQKDLVMSLKSGSSKMVLPTLTDPGEPRKRSDDFVEKYSSRKNIKTMTREDLPEDPGENEEFSVKTEGNNQSYISLQHNKTSKVLPKSAKQKKIKFVSQKNLQSLKSFNSINKSLNTIKQITELYKKSNKSLIRIDNDKNHKTLEYQKMLNQSQTLKDSQRGSFRFQSDDELNTSKYLNFKNKVFPQKNSNINLNLGSKDYERTKYKLKTNKTSINKNIMKNLCSNVTKTDMLNKINSSTECNYLPIQKLEKVKNDLVRSYNSFNSINKTFNFNSFNQKAKNQSSHRLHTSESVNSPNRKIINLPYVNNIKLKINEDEGANNMGTSQDRDGSYFEMESNNSSRVFSEDQENHESQEDYSIKIKKKQSQEELSSSLESENEEGTYNKNVQSRGQLKSKFLNQEIRRHSKLIIDSMKKEKFSNLNLKNSTNGFENKSNFDSTQIPLTNDSTLKSHSSNTKKNLLKFTDQTINDAKSLYSIKKNRTSKKVIINTNHLKGKTMTNEDSTYNKSQTKTRVISSSNLSEGEDEQIKNKIVNIVNNVNPKQDSKIEVELNINRYDIKLIHSNLDDIISQHSDISSSILEYSRELIRKLKKSDSVDNKVIHGKFENSMDKSKLFKRVNTLNPGQKFYFNERKVDNNQNQYGITLDDTELNSNRNSDNKKRKKIVINKRISKGYLRNEFSRGVKEEKKENETENEINKDDLTNTCRKKEEEIKLDNSGNNNEIYSITIKTETDELSQSRPSTSSQCEDVNLYLQNRVKVILNNIVENFVEEKVRKERPRCNFNRSISLNEDDLDIDFKKLKKNILASINCEDDLNENSNDKINLSFCILKKRSKSSSDSESSTHFNKFSIIEDPVKHEYEKFQALIENFEYAEKFELRQQKMKNYLLIKPDNWLNTECEFVKEELMSRVVRFFRISTNSKIKESNKKLLKKRIMKMYKYGFREMIVNQAEEDLSKEKILLSDKHSGWFEFSTRRPDNIGLMREYIEDNYFNYYRTIIEALYVESYLSEDIKFSRGKTLISNFTRKPLRKNEQFSILKIMKNKLKSEKKEEIKIEEGKNKKMIIWLQGMDHFERGESKQEEVIRYFKQIVRRNKIDRVKRKYEKSIINQKGNHDESSGHSDDSIIKRATENKIKKLENYKRTNTKINIIDLQVLRRLSKKIGVKKKFEDFSILNDENFFQLDSKEKFPK
jgi:hypothetical protein